jgi:DNA modification methylase
VSLRRPPISYFGLRDYGTAEWEGGDPGCGHEPPQEWIDHNFNANSAFGKGAVTQSAAAKGRWYMADGSCRCGARRIDRQLGLEPTPAEYVAALVGVMREVRRVLRDDGTLWLNLGDSYAGSVNTGGTASIQGNAKRIGAMNNHRRDIPVGLKPKNLIGIPWRVAFALQADGWYLRSDIIWAKPNPMPESVTDRPTKAHEYVFMLSKRERYYFDADAIALEGRWQRRSRNPSADRNDGHGNDGAGANYAAKVNPNGTRNARTVWNIATQPYPQSHFATFPEELARRCIMAGCPVGGIVLDPFAGSGTVGAVAVGNGRSAVLCELNPDYTEMARQRIGPMFVDGAA